MKRLIYHIFYIFKNLINIFHFLRLIYHHIIETNLTIYPQNYMG